MITTKHAWHIILFSLLAGLLAATVGANDDVASLLESLSQPVADVSGLNPLIDAAKDKTFVLLGEASHGTSEFYTWRADISRRLILEHDFKYIAVEGDWDACWELNRYVKGLPGAANSAETVLRAFDRWPLWMWANREVETLIEWLRDHNSNLPEKDKVGFYGIDVYGFEGSLRAVVAYLIQLEDEAALAAARAVQECLGRFVTEPHDYARAVFAGVVDCAPAAEAAVALLTERADALRARDAVGWFNAKQHALVVKNAERHYRAMAAPAGDSWNTRVAHFHRTVERLADFYGPDAKGVVWAHNTHIGDARATPMAGAGRHNIGQLLREKQGDAAVFAVGFGTHRGAVLAGRQWGAPMERMTVPPAIPNSLEDMLQRAGHDVQLLVFDRALRDGILATPLPHRAIGVTYDPTVEHLRNYVPTVLPQRYDAFIFISETTALDPIHP